ncbi:MAG: pitrilysin family protein [Nanoarchaeota archaeon]
MKPKFFRKVLKNGMTVLFEKRELPVVSVAFAVRCGGINEDAKEKGISHFIEHMLYKGTPTRNASQISTEIEKNGGVLNGFTSETITAYWCKMPSNKINVALDVLSDMVKNPLFNEAEMNKERKVIFEEIKMRKDNPRIHVDDRIQNFLYDAPLGIDLIGTHETMNPINREKMLKRFNEVYNPNNMILCVVGDADFEKLVEFSEKNFNNKAGKIPEYKVKKKNNSAVEKRKGLDQANVVFAYHAPLSNDKKSYAARVLSAVLAEGMSSRLFSEIREKRNLAYSISGEATSCKYFSYNKIYAGTQKENIGKVKELILEEFKKVGAGLEEKELRSIKEQLIGNYNIAMEESVSQMANLLYYEADGNAQEFYEFEKNIKEVKLEDVKELAKKAIKEYSFFALVPE